MRGINIAKIEKKAYKIGNDLINYIEESNEEYTEEVKEKIGIAHDLQFYYMYEDYSHETFIPLLKEAYDNGNENVKERINSLLQYIRNSVSEPKLVAPKEVLNMLFEGGDKRTKGKNWFLGKFLTLKDAEKSMIENICYAKF